MPSGWEVYYVVFLSAVLALAIPAILALVSAVIAQRGALPQDLPGSSLGVPEARDTALGRRINTRFFLSANAALILITLALVLVPYASTLQADVPKPTALRGLISIVTIVAFSSLGLLYAARKGDLNWLRSYRRPGESK